MTVLLVDICSHKKKNIAELTKNTAISVEIWIKLNKDMQL